jgi:hypothetical protein
MFCASIMKDVPEITGKSFIVNQLIIEMILDPVPVFRIWELARSDGSAIML